MRRNALKQVVAGLTLASLGLRARAGAAEPRLLGRWRSDRERTLKAVPVGWGQERVAVLSRLVGSFEWDFTTDTLFVNESGPNLPGHRVPYQYQVVARDDQSVVLALDVLGRTKLQQIFFEGEYLYSFGGYVEYFRRIAA